MLYLEGLFLTKKASLKMTRHFSFCERFCQFSAQGYHLCEWTLVNLYLDLQICCSWVILDGLKGTVNLIKDISIQYSESMIL